jgi:hypothetical protein
MVSQFIPDRPLANREPERFRLGRHRHRPSPVFYQFHFDIQKESGSDILLEAGYLGNISHHLSANDLTLNQVPTQLFGPGNSQLLRPVPQSSNVTSLNPKIGNPTESRDRSFPSRQTRC